MKGKDMTSKNDTGGHAFPFPSTVYEQGKHTVENGDYGMTLRDWFAGMALQGICSQLQAHPKHSDIYAKFAYEQADKMIETRQK